MRISDWSSDVCSSDLNGACGGEGGFERLFPRGIGDDGEGDARDLPPVPPHQPVRVAADQVAEERAVPGAHDMNGIDDARHRRAVAVDRGKSEERRVGKECRSTCRSRWSPYN